MKIQYFDGYFRNAKALAEQLHIKGGIGCDIEAQIIKSAWKTWGIDMMSHFHGAFAMVLHDEQENKTYAIRDQLGLKQLFYAFKDGAFIFSDNPMELAGFLRVSDCLNDAVIQTYLTFGFLIGEDTFFPGIKKVLAGHYVCCGETFSKTTRYWQPHFQPDYGKSESEWADLIHETLKQIIREEKACSRSQSGSVLLSGGVDSGYLLALTDFDAAVIEYGEEAYDESRDALQTAKTLGRKARRIRIGPDHYFQRVSTIIRHMGQPSADASSPALSIAMDEIGKTHQIIYSGEGIDEFFGGYYAYRKKLPLGEKYWTCFRRMDDLEISKILLHYDDNAHSEKTIAPLWEMYSDLDEFNQKLAIDISLYLDGDIYYNSGMCAKGVQKELRCPFSDIRLFEIASSIPPELKLKNMESKYIFRLAAEKLLPHKIAFRKKRGFPVPTAVWMADSKCNHPVEEVLFGKAAERFFDMSEIRRLWNEMLTGRENKWFQLYGIYSFLLWMKQSHL